MDTSGPPDRATRRSTTARRTAVVLWLVLGFVSWNVVFDQAILEGGREYLIRQLLHGYGQGPGATIHGVMDGAASRGAWRATAVGGGIAAAGLALVWLAGRRRANSLLGRSQ
jgi:hypothetical protein